MCCSAEVWAQAALTINDNVREGMSDEQLYTAHQLSEDRISSNLIASSDLSVLHTICCDSEAIDNALALQLQVSEDITRPHNKVPRHSPKKLQCLPLVRPPSRSGHEVGAAPSPFQAMSSVPEILLKGGDGDAQGLDEEVVGVSLGFQKLKGVAEEVEVVHCRWVLKKGGGTGAAGGAAGTTTEGGWGRICDWGRNEQQRTVVGVRKCLGV